MRRPPCMPGRSGVAEVDVDPGAGDVTRRAGSDVRRPPDAVEAVEPVRWAAATAARERPVRRRTAPPPSSAVRVLIGGAVAAIGQRDRSRSRRIVYSSTSISPRANRSASSRSASAVGGGRPRAAGAPATGGSAPGRRGSRRTRRSTRSPGAAAASARSRRRPSPSRRRSSRPSSGPPPQSRVHAPTMRLRRPVPTGTNVPTRGRRTARRAGRAGAIRDLAPCRWGPAGRSLVA